MSDVFIAALLASFADDSVRLVVGQRAGKVVLMAFMQKVGFARWSSFMPSQEPVCLYLSEDGVIDDISLRAIAKALPGVVLQIDLLQVDNVILSPAANLKAMPYIETGALDVPADFPAYFASLGKNLRQNYNKVVNRASKDNLNLSIEPWTSPEQVEEGVRLYGEIESASWKAEHNTAISPTNQQGIFYTRMMRELAERGQAVVWLYKINDEVAAVDLCVHNQGTLIILKTTYKEAFSKLSPALQLKVDMLRYYAEQTPASIKRIEFYGKAMDWHKRLNSELRWINHQTWYKAGWVEGLIGLVRRLR
ncbi:GNAT family N-acetyltransferase [Bowmanella denitrificans]|uniref:GNAT family N-acetyltransferase n=1 Tax=Bowmanella denitrificans TaxID=366582 RepID=UPI001559ED6B|nr:GNAT family N-acetyltransferase [Bowmanella denitrificans]